MSQLTARFDLPISVEAPKAARDAVQSLLWSWGFQDLDWMSQVKVVVSELVTNAIRHGGGRVQVDIHAHGHDVTIGAAYGSAALPRQRDAAEPDDGYGMTLIEAMVIRWGIDDHGGGKRVWLRLPPPSPPVKHNWETSA